MKKQKPSAKGTTLLELITALGLFGVIMTLATSFFSLATNNYRITSAQIETLGGAQQAVKRLAAELQETDASSVQFSSSHDALVFISARNSSGKFQTSNGSPNWQKWVYYATIQDPNGPYSLLVRKESATIFGGLPSTADQSPPANWQTQFQNLTGNQLTIASAIQNFQIEDCDCDAGALLHSPYYIQVISSIMYKGVLTSYNPGYLTSAISSCTNASICTGTGYWVQAQVINP